MHLCIFSLICCALLFTEVYADDNIEMCKNNLPETVRSTLITVLEEHSGNVEKKKLKFNCELAALAFERSYADSDEIDYFRTFDRTSTFDFSWKESFERALNKEEEGDEGDKVVRMWGLIPRATLQLQITSIHSCSSPHWIN
ncbi:hypothetical protein GCK32_009477 [Trichostrongylus colubriformis]|uniref:Uncharacterized protein n=1 Tax=Trichostrongylus colubriformis TaxID=6319 RepID=A0AAN8FZU6_TRICO